MKRSIIVGLMLLCVVSSVFALPAITGQLVASGRCLLVYPDGSTSEYWGVGLVGARLYIDNVLIATNHSSVLTGGWYGICTQNLSPQMAELITRVELIFDGQTVDFKGFSIKKPISHDFIKHVSITPPNPWLPVFQ